MGRDDKRHQLLAGIMIRGRQNPEASRVGFVWGAMIALIGLLLLLDHLELVHIGSLFRFWPMILVCFGIGHLFTRSNRTAGVVLFCVGAIFQLNNLGITHMGLLDLWPVAIIAVGVMLMWGAMKPVVSKTGGPVDSADTINAVAIFGGAERRIASKTFKGGKTVSIFGGVELDLRDADIDGTDAALEVQCLFGGVEIRVPTHWNVHSTSIPVLGGYSDKTHNTPVADSATSTRKTLTISGSVVFGGVEISN